MGCCAKSVSQVIQCLQHEVQSFDHARGVDALPNFADVERSYGVQPMVGESLPDRHSD